MRCGNSQNMENEKGIISYLPSFYLSPSPHHCCSFSNPNYSFSLSITISIAKHHHRISLPRFFSLSSVSSCYFRILSSFRLGLFSPLRRRRRFELYRAISPVFFYVDFMI